MDIPPRSARRPIDAAALANTVRRLQRLAAPPWLHLEAARRMAERLSVIRMQPGTVLDWDAFLGGSKAVLSRAYPRARRVAVETAASRPANAAPSPWWSLRRWGGQAPAVVQADAVPAGQAQLVWSNMGLHLQADPQAVMRQWHAALAVDGFLMFSTLGPGTLVDLRAVYDQQGWPAPFAPFVDMHDLGDMLVEAGFADPVMDQEQLTLTWDSADALLAELRQIGGNFAWQREPGLRTRGWREQLLAALQARSDPGGRIGLRFELVYGHAFRPLPRPRLAAEIRLPVDDLRAMARAGRAPRRQA